MNPPEFEASRQFWDVASSYPASKEAKEVYGRAHAEAHGFDAHPGARVLEYGCGGGADAMSWLARGCDVTFVDIVSANVVTTDERMRARFGDGPFDPPRCRAHGLILARTAPLSFEDASFDVVNSHGVVHHISTPEPVVAEFFRVLRPGGTVYVMLYTEMLFERCRPQMTPDLTIEQAFGAMTDGWGCPYARPYTAAEGRALLESAGFVVELMSVYNDGDFRTYRGRKP